MKSTEQRDIFVHSDAANAGRYLKAAETVRKDPHFSPDDGEARARLYEQQARELYPGAFS